ncbi:NFACT RNA binding domain-containing protein [Thermoproteota archaeon]
MKITLNIKKTLEQNASVYYEKAKKSKKKLEGARKALEESRKKYKKQEKTTTAELAEAEEKAKPKKKRAKKWYEKFRWFYTSDGFLCIGGRDATTNEIVIKKNTDKDDVVFHTDMAGSPFFVIKKNSQPDKDISETAKQEATDATLAFSRAWKLGLVNASVFNVSPDQVTKEAQSGEYIPKGAFMIRGKTNYLPPRNQIAIGAYEDTVMAGPLDAVKAHCKEYLQIIRGKRKSSDVAKSIRKKLGGELDDIIAALPPGNCDIKK